MSCIVFLRWVCNISCKIGAKAFDFILERQRAHSGPAKCFNEEEVIKICTTMLDSEQVKKLVLILIESFLSKTNYKVPNVY